MLWEPYRLVDAGGAEAEPVSAYLREVQAAGCAEATLRSYGLDLLRWFRFLWAVEVAWDRADRVEARDFSRWLQIAEKPAGRGSASPAAPAVARAARVRSGAVTPNAVTGRSGPGPRYAPRTVAHSETVLRAFYDAHRRWGSGPVVNPFPLARQRDGGRPNAHHNPMRSFRNERVGLYRPRVPRRVPRAIPDQRFDELFAALSCHRDRALAAFYVSTGARASEPLGATQADADPGGQLITVVRKGSRAMQRLPASTDAFVWLRLYQQEMHGLAPVGADQPLWWTLRAPVRALTYHAARAALNRAQAAVGSNWTLHDFRHTAAYRMARDPQVSLTDVQWVLGHVRLTTTQIYLTPFEDEVITTVRAHHARQTRTAREAKSGQADPRPLPPPVPAPGYRPDSLDVLFGRP